ncbi:hypothetical protein A5674_07305 [Mycobacterium malmoense]|uniref:hypothetical protein n=1 Tax=Mycobacterium malmoense TaxID=1780 RepID=UPI00080B7852|nr:hypothetical protein [Mycobacterium malmoense]OCB19269.1 hypothetical protein A5674_07305 [Mycobacterium malmoense]
MTTEAQQIAARLAAASEVFPLPRSDDFDSRVDVIAEGTVLSIVVTDHLGRAKREYRAVIQCIAGDARTPSQ